MLIMFVKKFSSARLLLQYIFIHTTAPDAAIVRHKELDGGSLGKQYDLMA